MPRGVVVVFALASAACFMDQATPGGAEDTGSETSATPSSGSSADSGSGSGSDAESSTPTSTSSATTDTTPTDTTPTDSNPTDTSPGECPVGEMCLPIGDGEWMGPIVTQVVASDAPPPSCPAGWSAGPTGLLGLEDGNPTCNCTCPDEPEVVCEYFISFDGGLDCNGGNVSSTYAGADACVTSTDGSAHSVIAYDFTDDVDCGTAQADPLPPPIWAERIDACVPTLGDSCPLGACVSDPVGFPGSLCITHAGDVMCPEGPFDRRTVAYSDYDDMRMCACSCSVVFATCGGTLVAYGTDSCGSDLGGTDVGTCNGQHDTLTSAMITGALPTAQCLGVTVGGPAPSGQVTPTGPQTFCCDDP